MQQFDRNRLPKGGDGASGDASLLPGATPDLARLRLVPTLIGEATPEGTCGWDAGIAGTHECGLPAGHPGDNHWMVPK